MHSTIPMVATNEGKDATINVLPRTRVQVESKSYCLKGTKRTQWVNDGTAQNEDVHAVGERGHGYNGKSYCHERGYMYTANRIASEYGRTQWVNEGTGITANRIAPNEGTKGEARVHR